MENSKNKKFMHFNLHTVLSSMIKSCAVLLHPTWDMNHPCVYISTLYAQVQQDILRDHIHKTFITQYNCSIFISYSC